ncbi:MAG: Gfo/Idh/MocA family oxidoreductase [Bryobacteraceae bacterium]
MIRAGIIGFGYWGPNLVRNFAEVPGVSLAAVADLREDRLAVARRRYPGVGMTTDVHAVLRDPSIDAVAIATPVSTHFPLALEALRAGKHVMIEKPMTSSVEEALRLVDEAERANRVLMVDHTFVYTGAVRKIRDLIDCGSLGNVYYYDSTRVNLGLFQHDVDVMWDLAVHDVAIMDYLFPDSPTEVSATGVGHVDGASQNLAYVTALFNNSLIAHLNVNWLSPVKVRRTLIGGSKQMVVYDDIEVSEKVKVYDKGIDIKNGDESRCKLLVSYRSGDMFAPKLDGTEALRVAVQHFAECIQDGKKPLTDGLCGLRVVSVLEAATRSMTAQGRPEPVNVNGAAKHSVPVAMTSPNRAAMAASA